MFYQHFSTKLLKGHAKKNEDWGFSFAQKEIVVRTKILRSHRHFFAFTRKYLRSHRHFLRSHKNNLYSHDKKLRSHEKKIGVAVKYALNPIIKPLSHIAGFAVVNP